MISTLSRMFAKHAQAPRSALAEASAGFLGEIKGVSLCAINADVRRHVQAESSLYTSDNPYAYIKAFALWMRDRTNATDDSRKLGGFILSLQASDWSRLITAHARATDSPYYRNKMQRRFLADRIDTTPPMACAMLLLKAIASDRHVGLVDINRSLSSRVPGVRSSTMTAPLLTSSDSRSRDDTPDDLHLTAGRFLRSLCNTPLASVQASIVSHARDIGATTTHSASSTTSYTKLFALWMRDAIGADTHHHALARFILELTPAEKSRLVFSQAKATDSPYFDRMRARSPQEALKTIPPMAATILLLKAIAANRHTPLPQSTTPRKVAA